MEPDEIRELRYKLGLNQTEFADLVGTTQTQVSRWELGKNKPLKLFVLSIKNIENKPRVFGEDGPVYDAG